MPCSMSNDCLRWMLPIFQFSPVFKARQVWFCIHFCKHLARFYGSMLTQHHAIIIQHSRNIWVSLYVRRLLRRWRLPFFWTMLKTRWTRMYTFTLSHLVSRTHNMYGIHIIYPSQDFYWKTRAYLSSSPDPSIIIVTIIQHSHDSDVLLYVQWLFTLDCAVEDQR